MEREDGGGSDAGGSGVGGSEAGARGGRRPHRRPAGRTAALRYVTVRLYVTVRRCVAGAGVVP
ncbi:hypothetical protein [Streptomyces sp. AHA2]|uniref:hypothetical protein n=1 Tax=Streptomyces sp. AHA2 TaxID=3064526 RepID=UPI002FDF9258